MYFVNRQGVQCNVTSRHVGVTIFAVEKQSVLYVLSVCVCVALTTQHAKHMRRFIFSSVACLILSNFFTLSYKQYDVRKKKLIEHKMFFDFLYNSCQKHF